MTEPDDGGLGESGSDSGTKPSFAGESSHPGGELKGQLQGGGGQAGQRLALQPGVE